MMREEEFIKLAKNGCKTSFDRLMQEYRTELYLIAKIRLEVEADVEDAVQETLFDAYKHLKYLKNDKGFSTWIIKVLINNCNDINRRRCREPLCMDEIMAEKLPDACNGYFDINCDHDFLELINFLTNEEKTIMIMKYSNDFSNKEISETLNLSEGTIRTKLYRIKRKMREKYEDNRY